jgi:hypothetical protein
MSGQVDIVPQHQLTAVAGVSQEVARARLERVVWAAPRDDAGNIVGAPGLHDLRGTQRTMIVNDLTKHGIRCRIRIVSVEALAEVCRGAGVPLDPERPRLVVKGPTDASYVAGDIPWVDYELTTEWREYPAIFASWLDYRRGEDRRLGASYVAMRRVEDIAPGGEKVTRWAEYNVRAIDLFEFRLPGDDAGHAPLAVPGQRSQDAAEIAELRAAINELRGLLTARQTPDAAGLVGGDGVPFPDLSAPEPTPAKPVIVVPGERVLDERPGPGDKFTMEGGAHLGRDAYGDDTRAGQQVGYDPAEEYDADDGRAAPGELDKVVQQAGGGNVKARRRG